MRSNDIDSLFFLLSTFHFQNCCETANFLGESEKAILNNNTRDRLTFTFGFPPKLDSSTVRFNFHETAR